MSAGGRRVHHHILIVGKSNLEQRPVLLIVVDRYYNELEFLEFEVSNSDPRVVSERAFGFFANRYVEECMAKIPI